MQLIFRSPQCLQANNRLVGFAVRAMLGVVMFSCVLLCGRVAGASEPATPSQDRSTAQQADARRAVELVKALGAPRFQDREVAMRRLSELGIVAEAALRQGTQADDPEIRERCQLILQDVLHRDLQTRINQFKADLDGEESYGLPGFTEYAEMVGNKTATRGLFFDMFDQAPGVILALAEKPDNVTRVVDTYVENMFSFGADIMNSPAGITALFYASSLPETECQQQTAELLSFLAQGSTFADFAISSDSASACQTILDRWISHNARLAPPGDVTQMTLRFKLPAGLPIAETLATDRTAEPNDRLHGVLTLAKLGNSSHITLLHNLFDDHQLCVAHTVPGERWETQICDVALAATLHLAGEDPREFGFVNLEPSDITLFKPHSLSFSGERQRQMAFAKYYARFGQPPGDGN